MESIATYIGSLDLSQIQIFVIAFVLAFFLGEPLVLALSFLSATSDLLPIWQIMIIGYVTSILGEMFWFLIARSPFANFLGKKYSASVTNADFNRYAAKLERGNPLRLLFLGRLIAGISVVIIVYLSRWGLSTRKFLLYCLLINTFWTPVVTLLGYGAGEGYSILLHVFEGLRLVTEIVFGLLVVAYVMYRIFGKKPWDREGNN